MDNNYQDNGQESKFNWDDIRQRIAATEAALQGLDETSPEVLEQVWTRRAALLATKPVQGDQGTQVQLVLVRLGRELYGLNAQYILDIRPLEKVTRVPRVPNWVTGVTNLRGRIYSVVDLRRFFGLARAEGNGKDHEEGGEIQFLVVVETPQMEIALLVEDVLTVDSLPEQQIQEATGVVRGLRPEYVRGVVEHKNGDAAQSALSNGNGSMLVVLDLPALLADEQLIIHQEIV
jgi:purine-binding chemotaxis protein CheW